MYSPTWSSRKVRAAKLGWEAKRRAVKALPGEGKWAQPRALLLWVAGGRTGGQQRNRALSLVHGFSVSLDIPKS